MQRSAIHRRVPRQPRLGFTLVELMVVIAIIAVLSSLVVVAAMKSIQAVRQASIGFEIMQLSAALERYKSDIGAYPPDFVGTHQEDFQRIRLHLSSRFLNRNLLQDQDGRVMVNGVAFTPQYRGETFNGLDPSEALVFWLMGFSKDPLHPVSGAGDRTPYYDFKKERLADADGDGYMEYYPPRLKVPFVYYNSETYLAGLAASTKPAGLYPYGTKGASDISQPVPPYLQATVGTVAVTRDLFVEPKKFQILCAGLDGIFTTVDKDNYRVYPTTDGYAAEDYDNQANFSEGKPLEDNIP